MKTRSKWVWGVIVAVGLALIGLRIYLPTLIVDQANKKLASMQDYTGHIDGATMSLTRGAITLRGLVVYQRFARSKIPLAAVKAMDFSYEWLPLLHGEIVAKTTLHEPVVHYQLPPAKAPQKGPQPPPKQVLHAAKAAGARRRQENTAVLLQRIEIDDGRIEIVDPQTDPPFTFDLGRIHAVVQNVADSKGLFKNPASAQVSAVANSSGAVTGRFDVDPRTEKPTFAYRLQVRHLPLPALNPLWKKYLAVIAEDGTMDVYSEAHAKDGRIKGYVKPLLLHLNAVRVRGGKSLGRQLKGAAAKLSTEIFKNRPKNQIGTKAAFSGPVSGPAPHVFQAVWRLAANAFVKAIKPGLGRLVDFKALGF